MNSLKEWSSLILDTDPIRRIWLFSVHDWLAYLLKEPLWWNDYDTTIREVSFNAFGLTDQQTTLQIVSIIDAPLTNKCLLNRHYLCQKAIGCDIHLDRRYAPLHGIMLSMLVREPMFSTFSYLPVWDYIDGDPNTIDRLRSQQPLLLNQLEMLVNIDHDHDHSCVINHSYLSSLSLIYGLYLLKMIMTYELTIHPDSALTQLSLSLIQTLHHVKGVLTHVE